MNTLSPCYISLTTGCLRKALRLHLGCTLETSIIIDRPTDDTVVNLELAEARTQKSISNAQALIEQWGLKKARTNEVVELRSLIFFNHHYMTQVEISNKQKKLFEKGGHQLFLKQISINPDFRWSMHVALGCARGRHKKSFDVSRRGG